MEFFIVLISSMRCEKKKIIHIKINIIVKKKMPIIS